MVGRTEWGDVLAPTALKANIATLSAALNSFCLPTLAIKLPILTLQYSNVGRRKQHESANASVRC